MTRFAVANELDRVIGNPRDLSRGNQVDRARAYRSLEWLEHPGFDRSASGTRASGVRRSQLGTTNRESHSRSRFGQRQSGFGRGVAAAYDDYALTFERLCFSEAICD